MSARRLSLAYLVGLVAAGPALGVGGEYAAMATLQRYSHAVTSNDCATAYALTSDAVKRRDPYPSEFRDVLCAMLAEFQQQGLRESVGAPEAELVDGWRRIVFVRASRTANVPPNKITTNFEYIVHSWDGGRSWRVLDLLCVDARWVNEVFPAYAGTPEIRESYARITPSDAQRP